MKNKIDILEERINNLNNILGELDANELNTRSSRNVLAKEKLKNLSDVIIHLQKEISENDTIHFKDIYKKFEELSPLLDLEKLKDETNIHEREMYYMIITNFDELKAFLRNLNYVKENQNYLELNPIVDGQDKINKLKPYELRTMDLETKVSQVTDRIDALLVSYNETVDIFNKKFSMLSKIADKL